MRIFGEAATSDDNPASVPIVAGSWETVCQHASTRSVMAAISTARLSISDFAELSASLGQADKNVWIGLVAFGRREFATMTC